VVIVKPATLSAGSELLAEDSGVGNRDRSGYDRIAGALKNLGHDISDQTHGNILRRFGIAPAPKRRQQTTWADFIRSHMAVLAGVDFFTVEVLTWRGLATYYVLFFLHLETRRVTLAGITQHPTRNGWCRRLAMRSTTSIALFSGPALVQTGSGVVDGDNGPE
jgi:hypothetical protein